MQRRIGTRALGLGVGVLALGLASTVLAQTAAPPPAAAPAPPPTAAPATAPGAAPAPTPSVNPTAPPGPGQSEQPEQPEQPEQAPIETLHTTTEGGAATKPKRSTPPARVKLEAQAEPAPPKDPPGVREHDGFFARLGTGFTPWSETLDTRRESDLDEPLRVSTTGIATLDTLTLGWSISTRWVLGLDLQWATLLASTSRYSEDSTTVEPAQLDPGLRDFAMLGISALWFSNAKGGFNMGGGIGLGGLEVKRTRDQDYGKHTQYRAGGLGLNIEVGHTFWISEQWAVGLRGRMNAGFFSGKDNNDTEWIHGVALSPAALFDIMYH